MSFLTLAIALVGLAWLCTLYLRDEAGCDHSNLERWGTDGAACPECDRVWRFKKHPEAD